MSMNIEMQAVLFSLGTLLGWGLENSLSKKYSRILGASKLVVYRNLVTVVITLIALFIFRNSINFNLGYVVLGTVLAFIGYGGYYFFLKGLETGNLGIISPISSSRILISAIIGAVFLHDTLNSLQGVFILVIFVGVALSSLDFTNLRNSGIFNPKSGIPFAILNAIIWGTVFPLYSIPSAIIGAYLFSCILEVAGLVASLVQTKNAGVKIRLTSEELKHNALGLLLIGLTGGLGSVFISLGYATGKVSIVSAISSAVPLVAITYGRLVYKEELKLKHYLAISLMVIGIVCLAYFRS